LSPRWKSREGKHRPYIRRLRLPAHAAEKFAP